MSRSKAPAKRSAEIAGAKVDGRRISNRGAGGMAEHVRGYIYEQIISGTIQPGSIIQIAAIATALGVSRTPVREALLSLQRSRLVSVVPNQGFLVCTMSVSDVRDIYTMRAVLEAATAERAATRLSKQDLQLLSELNSKAHLIASTQYDAEFDRLCHDFHTVIARGAASLRLLDAVESIFDDHMRLQSIGVNPPNPQTIMAEHEAIHEALVANDAVAARTLMEVHIATLRRTAMETLAE